MTPETILDLFRTALYITGLIITVVVLPSLLVGLVIAILQAATQINEMSLSFIPKILVTFLALGVSGSWLLNVMMNYINELFLDLPSLIG